MATTTHNPMAQGDVPAFPPPTADQPAEPLTIQQIFAQVDTDHSGTIDNAEMREWLRGLQVKARTGFAKRFFREMEANPDVVVDLKTWFEEVDPEIALAVENGINEREFMAKEEEKERRVKSRADELAAMSPRDENQAATALQSRMRARAARKSVAVVRYEQSEKGKAEAKALVTLQGAMRQRSARAELKKKQAARRAEEVQRALATDSFQVTLSRLMRSTMHNICEEIYQGEFAATEKVQSIAWAAVDGGSLGNVDEKEHEF